MRRSIRASIRWSSSCFSSLRRTCHANQSLSDISLHIENGVILANPARAVIIAKLLRRQILQLHTLKASNQEKARKSDEIYAFMTSDRFEQFIGTIQNATKDLDDLQVEERKAHEKTWRRQGEMAAKLKKATSTFDEAVALIIAASTVSDGAPNKNALES